VIATPAYRAGQAHGAAATYARDALVAAQRATTLRTEAEGEPAGVAALTRRVADLYEQHAAHLGRMAREFAALGRAPVGERSAPR